MPEKDKVLVFIDWFYPAHKAGGPIRSVYNLIMALSDEIDFYVVTSAYDIGEIMSLEGVELNKWVKKENYSIIYLEKKYQTIKRYREVITNIKPTSIYLNSLFSVGFTLKPIVANTSKVRTVLAPRGMLKNDALAIKPLKKQLFLSLMRKTGFLRSIIWHTSSIIESEEVFTHFGLSAKVVIAQNMAIILPKRPPTAISKLVGQLRLVFVARISPIKNLDFLLNVLKELNNQNVILDIYGPIEDVAYWKKCLKVIDDNSVNVFYKGVLGQYEKEKVLWQYDYMILPTKGENYGHVIVESLCASLPVIISQNTPWRNLAEKHAGFDLAMDTKKFEACLNQLIQQDQDAYYSFSRGAYQFSKQYILNQKVIEENKKLFLKN